MYKLCTSLFVQASQLYFTGCDDTSRRTNAALRLCQKERKANLTATSTAVCSTGTRYKDILHEA